MAGGLRIIGNGDDRLLAVVECPMSKNRDAAEAM
jgi:hypothetical protein